MAESEQRASVSKGRAGYCVTFRHPVAKASDGTSKLRVRRGLGTQDAQEASRLVAQMTEILNDPSSHTVAGRTSASARYDARIVAAFYDYIAPIAKDAWAEREKVIPLPGIQDNYAKAMVVGTTGSGKTTLVRQLIGTDPKEERFPSTSAAKTTTADIEVILAGSQTYSAVVSFTPQDQVRQNVSDCIVAAVAGHVGNVDQGEIIRRFMEHSEQRFRLSYLLGFPEVSTTDEEEEDENAESLPPGDSEVSAEQRVQFAATLTGYLKTIEAIADGVRGDIRETAHEFGIDLDSARAQDREAINDLVEEKLLTKQDFDSLLDDIMEEIEARLELVEKGEFVRGVGGWPSVWTFSLEDRADFIRVVNRFSSNYAPNFGRLLTPIVDGIRVRGPFRPNWLGDGEAGLVLLDGQGIGHTADTSASLSTAITRRFGMADAILLVDNAAQPMQAGSVAVLRALVTSGHESKLIVCFTHFDSVTGDNLPSDKARRNHVTGSLHNAIHALGQHLGRDAEQSLKRLTPDRVIFVSAIHEASVLKRTTDELKRLIDCVRKMIVPPPPTELRPVYDVANLHFATQRASQAFHARWRSVLATEHWARVKALARRVSVYNMDEYNQLRPVADLILQLQTYIHTFLATPFDWSPSTNTDERLDEKSQITDAIRRSVSTRLHDLAHHRLIDLMTREWREAYDRRGRGSTLDRARDIGRIYERAAPVPIETPEDDAMAFIHDIRSLVMESILTQNGVVKGWSAE